MCRFTNLEPSNHSTYLDPATYISDDDPLIWPAFWISYGWYEFRSEMQQISK